MQRIRLFVQIAAAGACLLLGVGLAAAELANVILRDGSRLRGDVTTTDAEIVVSNAAGEVRYKKGEVAEIEWASAPASLDEEYLRRFRVLMPDDIARHFELAEWAREKERFDLVTKQCNYILGLQPDHANARLLLELAQSELAEHENRANDPTRRSGAKPRAGAGLAEPALLSELDITRLRMYEFPTSDVPKSLRVRFLPQRGAPELIEQVKQELIAEDRLDGGLRERLEKGKPAEQLNAITDATGGKYAARVEISGDPPAFATFRRKVLPLVAKGCATAGCHGGDNAVTFRLPGNASSSDAAAYAAFLILDQLPTVHGPLINRKRPEESPLITYMLPRTPENDRPHPPTPGERVSPRLRGARDPNYEALADWVASLREPHPQYELDWPLPDWLSERHQRMQPPIDATPTSQPTSEPAVPAGEG